MSHRDPTVDPDQIIEPLGFDFGLSRRGFVQMLGAGLLIAVSAPVLAQDRGRSSSGGGRRESSPAPLSARLHLPRDGGTITVLTGKVEGGQGARAQITQAAAEELRVAPDRLRLVMADTSLCPDDGITAGSRTTPSTLPAVRQACAAARLLLTDFAAKQWDVPAAAIDISNGAARHAASNRSLTYADLASAGGDTVESFKRTAPRDTQVTPVAEWRSLGAPLPRPNARDIVTGSHQYPSDVVRPNMLYGKVLRAPSYGAQLESVDLAPAQAMDGVVVVRDGTFVAVAAPTTHAARLAIRAVEQTARWTPAAHPSSAALPDHLRQHARGGVPANPFASDLSSATKALRATYVIPYVQHAPMEPRAAVAEWDGDRLTVWTASQNPFGVRRELAAAFHLADDRVRVIIPDFGGGFGGKHTGETAVEAARLARAAGRPVAIHWTRQEEFTWASFRPAGVMELEASLDAAGTLSTWYHVNINSGPSSIETPYRVPKARSQHIQSDPPLRHGSYRALAATANTFARESFMDELAVAASRDPLDFRLAHLADNSRLRAVLEAAAAKFDWTGRRNAERSPDVGIGVACGTEKGSFVATCAEVSVDREKGIVTVRRICEAYECGKITSPVNLRSQVVGAVIQALGPALREAMEFEDGRIRNPSFRTYLVPRLADVPELDIHLLDRPDLPSVGAGETPLISVAPAIANAVFDATNRRLRQLPLKVSPASS